MPDSQCTNDAPCGLCEACTDDTLQRAAQAADEHLRHDYMRRTAAARTEADRGAVSPLEKARSALRVADEGEAPPAAVPRAEVGRCSGCFQRMQPCDGSCNGEPISHEEWRRFLAWGLHMSVEDVGLFRVALRMLEAGRKAAAL